MVNVVIVALAAPLMFRDQLLWNPRNVPDETMISAIYFAMGVVMICAARAPQAHKSLVDFVILANLLHAAVMLVYAERPLHIAVDVSSIGILGAVPLFIYPWGLRSFLRYPIGLSRSGPTTKHAGASVSDQAHS